MLLPSFVLRLLNALSRLPPPFLSQLTFSLLYALVLSVVLTASFNSLCYLDYRAALALRRRGSAPSDLQRLALAATQWCVRWGRVGLVLMVIGSALWTFAAPARRNLGDDAPQWLAQFVDGWDRQVLARIHGSRSRTPEAPRVDVADPEAPKSRRDRRRVRCREDDADDLECVR